MKNKIFSLFAWVSFSLFLVIFSAVAGDIILKGFSHFQISFLFSDFKNSGRSGGIFPILVSTVLTTAAALVISATISLISAISIDHLKKFKLLNRVLKLSLDTLSATPSIVFGLIGNILFCEYLGLGYSLLSGALTLALMILPIQARIILIGLSSIDKDLELAIKALNLRGFTIYFKIKIHLIKNQIVSGSFIGLGRALAETAALLFTSGYGIKTPQSLLDSGRTISIHIYELSMNVPGGNINAYKSAFTLIFLVFVISAVSNRVQKKMSRHQMELIWN